MIITPIASGTGIPAGASESTNKTLNPDSRARAIAIASGQDPDEKKDESTGDAQVDRAKATIKKIKMKTNASTNRHEVEPMGIPEEPALEQVLTEPEIPISHVNRGEASRGDEPQTNQVPEETRPLSPQFAALAKAKRALQVKEREIAQRENALKTQNQAGSGDYISKAELLSNPMKVFEAGVTYDQLTEAILNNQNNQGFDVKTIDALVEKKLNERLEKEFGTRDSQAEAQVLADIKREIVQTVNSNPDNFEAIRQANAVDDVQELIHRTWKKTGEVLDVSEAAELVENQLIEEALPFAKLKKLQSRLTPPEQEQIVQPQREIKPNTKIMRTLTNRDSASPIMDKRSRAIAAMLGTLKRG